MYSLHVVAGYALELIKLDNLTTDNYEKQYYTSNNETILIEN